jgi:hypothetical protein
MRDCAPKPALAIFFSRGDHVSVLPRTSQTPPRSSAASRPSEPTPQNRSATRVRRAVVVLKNVEQRFLTRSVMGRVTSVSGTEEFHSPFCAGNDSHRASLERTWMILTLRRRRFYPLGRLPSIRNPPRPRRTQSSSANYVYVIARSAATRQSGFPNDLGCEGEKPAIRWPDPSAAPQDDKIGAAHEPLGIPRRDCFGPSQRHRGAVPSNDLAFALPEGCTNVRTIKVNAIITSIVTGTYRSGTISDPRGVLPWHSTCRRRCQPRRWPGAAASGGHSESGRIIGRGPAGADRGKNLKKWTVFDRAFLTRIG